MSQLDALLSRLTQVKGRAGNYVACCPAHEDRKPSLAVKEQDGKIIMHCFAGCTVENIVGAVGMSLTDLFPPSEKPSYTAPAPKVKFYATDLLRVIALEAAIVSVAAYDMSKGKTLPQHDLDRLQVAYQRISTAMESANG